MCIVWLDRKYCKWTYATGTLYINIYLHRECCKISFICYLIVTAKNLIWPVVFYFSVHGDQQRNNIYLQCCNNINNINNNSHNNNHNNTKSKIDKNTVSNENNKIINLNMLPWNATTISLCIYLEIPIDLRVECFVVCWQKKFEYFKNNSNNGLPVISCLPFYLP